MRALLLASCLSLTAACGITDFHVDQRVPEQRIDGSPVPAALQLLFPVPLDVTISAKIKEQEPGPIDGVYLSSLHLDITTTDEPAGDQDDWAFLTRVDLYITSTREGSTLPRIKVASASAPGPVRRLDFTPEGANLVRYVDEGARLTAEATGTAPADDVSFDGLADFRVEPL